MRRGTTAEEAWHERDSCERVQLFFVIFVTAYAILKYEKYDAEIARHRDHQDVSVDSITECCFACCSSSPT